MTTTTVALKRAQAALLALAVKDAAITGALEAIQRALSEEAAPAFTDRRVAHQPHAQADNTHCHQASTVSIGALDPHGCLMDAPVAVMAGPTGQGFFEPFAAPCPLRVGIL